jgi:thiol-disulfide isomerase/thioredoxin/YHS domain-containing protein
MTIQTNFSTRCGLAIALSTLFLLTTSVPVSAGESGINWSTDIEGSLQKAAAENRTVLMEFTAPWCVYCKRMEKTTFVDPTVASAVNSRFVPVKVNADQHKALVKDLGIKGLPAMLVVSPDLTIIDRISGFQTADALLKRIQKIPVTEVIATTPRAADISRPVGFDNNTAVAQQQQTAGRVRMAPTPEPAPIAAPAQENPFAVTPNSAVATESVAAPSEPAAFDNAFAVEPPTAPQENPFAPSQSTPSDDVSGRVSLGETATTEAPSTAGKVAAFDPTAPSTSQTTQRFAFEGACPVAAIDNRKLTPGKAAYEIEHRGQAIRFSSLEARISFESAPERYWPMLDGACPVTLARTGQRTAGDLRHAVLFRKRIWLLADEEAMNTFVANPGQAVQQALIQLQQTATVTQ